MRIQIHIQGWELSLLMLGTLPIIAGCGAWMAVAMANLTAQSEKAYRGAGGVAEQVYTMRMYVFMWVCMLWQI
jgi:hypothetical protein